MSYNCYYSYSRGRATFVVRHSSSSSRSSISSDDGDDMTKTELDMANLYREWTLEQDQALWQGYEDGKKSLIELAVLTGRGLGGVRARLAKLQDVDSAAYERLFVVQQRAKTKKNRSKRTTDAAASSTSTDEEEWEDSKNNKNDEKQKKKLVPASQVLRRIQWDYNLNGADFSILHYDRVEDRIVESSVEAPNENISGKATRLVDALPEHRIMAIKYRQRIIWDRKERLDLMFGSDDVDGSGGIQRVMETYDEWKREQDAVLEQMEQRRTRICHQVRQRIGWEAYAELEHRLADLQSDMSSGLLIPKMEIETLVQQAQDLLSGAPTNTAPSLDTLPQSLDPTWFSPLSDDEALDVFSEWIVHLPPNLCLEQLKSTILNEIGLQLQEQTKSQQQFLSGSILNNNNNNNNRPLLPDIDEADLTETFVRGSGPGGQKINKTSNRVVLVHNPTQVRVECQETRSLPQNRKIARKRLREKLDEFFHGSQSKAKLKEQLLATKKAKAKARSRARLEKKKLKKEDEEQKQQQQWENDRGEKDGRPLQ